MADGKGCTCAAYSASECGCDADWTPQEIYDLRDAITKLRAERDALAGTLAAARAEQDKWYQAYQSMLDPIVRAKMLEPAPPMIAPVGMAEQVLLRERDQLHADLAAARALLNRVLSCTDLHGWNGEKASLLCDEIDAALAKGE